MHLKNASPAAAILAGLFLAAAPPVAAQQSAVDTAQSTTTQQLQKPLKPATSSSQAPMLYEGEMEDLGPQYVLQPHERPKYFQVMADFQLYHTNNAVLAPNNKLGTDVSVFTLQAAVQSQTAEMFDGWQVQTRAGVRYQSYWYGVFSGRNQNTATTFSPVKFNDFEIFSPFAEINFKFNPWYGSYGLRYAAFINTDLQNNQDENFYQEWVPSGTLGYQVNLADNRILQFQYDGDFRSTNTDEKGLHPVGWEDRTDQAFSVIYSYILGEHWVIQPSYRFMWSDYTNPGRYRNDVYNTFSFMVAYYFNESVSARAFTSYEFRSSSEFGNNYQNWNLGVGLSLNASF